MQLICASATVGRSLRRQLQGLLGAPSVEKAAELIAAADRDVKAAGSRRAALMPATLRHAYHLVGAAVEEEAAEEKAEEEEAEVAAEEEKEVAVAVEAAAAGAPDASVAGEEVQGAGRKRQAAASVEAAMLLALREAMSSLPAAPSIIFAGRLGVEAVASALSASGMRDVRRMKEAHEDAEVGEEAAEEVTVGEEMAEEGVFVDERPASTKGGEGASWADTPVYVGSERWGRGLDLNVGYVFMLSPPSSTASYTHLAGRTGRRGREGTAVTILTHMQVPRLVAFAEQLAIPFEAVHDTPSPNGAERVP